MIRDLRKQFKVEGLGRIAPRLPLSGSFVASFARVNHTRNVNVNSATEFRYGGCYIGPSAAISRDIPAADARLYPSIRPGPSPCGICKPPKQAGAAEVVSPRRDQFMRFCR
jgi:hypothetical protein